jgi:hypothetical protein
MTEKCIDCKRNYNVLEKGLCFYCHVIKYKEPPNTGLYKIEKKNK